MKKRKIVLTGGGTAGHVSVNLAIIPLLLEKNWEIHYLGSKNGIEKELISDIEEVKYHEIPTGKLRRYLSFRNLLDIFKVFFGIIKSIILIFFIKPNIAFSKGGYVSVPVVIGSWINRVPIISHESDLTPGLANKINLKFIKFLFTTFPETSNYIDKNKSKFLGPVIRKSLKNGSPERAKSFLKIENEKPVILVMGGSQGAGSINKIVRNNIDELTKNFNVIHATGKDGYDASFIKKDYYQFDYIKENLNDILAYSDISITRSGSNAIFEFLYYKIPMLMIPFPKTVSRGDQIDNAKSFEKNGFGKMLEEENMNNEIFLSNINEIYLNINDYKNNMSKFNFDDADKIIVETIEKYSK